VGGLALDWARRWGFGGADLGEFSRHGGAGSCAHAGDYCVRFAGCHCALGVGMGLGGLVRGVELSGGDGTEELFMRVVVVLL